MSGTERRVWYRLRRKNLGAKFRRQYAIGPYFADFVCLSARLVIEVDGTGHDDLARDQRKTDYLEGRGFHVVRVPASATDQNLDGVIDTIWIQLQEPMSPP
jgi:very-short-patch-repair endonuclease